MRIFYILTIKGKNLSISQTYLSNLKQYIEYVKDKKTGKGVSYIIHGVPHGSSLGPLLFITLLTNYVKRQNFWNYSFSNVKCYGLSTTYFQFNTKPI